MILNNPMNNPNKTPLEEFPYIAQGRAVQIVEPRETILESWILCRSRDGAEWFVPILELKPSCNYQICLGDLQ